MKNSCYMHIPKTGGRWIKNMIHKYVEHDEIHIAGIYWGFGEEFITSHDYLNPYTKVPFYFVREPSSWIASLWKTLATLDSRWIPKDIMELFVNEYASDVDRFVDNICLKNNWVSMVYSYWTDNLENPLVGKVETLNSDFLHILQECGERHDSISIMSAKRYGQTIDPVILTNAQRERILDSNTEYCEKYGY